MFYVFQSITAPFHIQACLHFFTILLIIKANRGCWFEAVSLCIYRAFADFSFRIAPAFAFCKSRCPIFYIPHFPCQKHGHFFRSFAVCAAFGKPAFSSLNWGAVLSAFRKACEPAACAAPCRACGRGFFQPFRAPAFWLCSGLHRRAFLPRF